MKFRCNYTKFLANVLSGQPEITLLSNCHLVDITVIANSGIRMVDEFGILDAEQIRVSAS